MLIVWWFAERERERREAAECEKINLRAQSERNPKYRFKTIEEKT